MNPGEIWMVACITGGLVLVVEGEAPISRNFLKLTWRTVNEAQEVLGCRLSTSSLVDAYLWFTIEYHVSCWTIAVFSTATIVLLQVLKRAIR